MSELRIYFADLIAFVPLADGSYWVLLPEARQQAFASDGITVIDSHYPVALFDLPNQGGSDWQQIHQLLKLTPPAGNHEAWLLSRQELRIGLPAAPPVQAPGAPAIGLPKPNNRTDFTWVPVLSTLGLPARVEAGCFQAAGSSPVPSTKIVSRLHLDSGTLTTFQFVKRTLTTFPYDLRLPLLEFKALGGVATFGTARACADVVVAAVPFAGPTIDISAVSLDTGAIIRTIRLTAVSGVVNMLVGNLSPETGATPTPPFGVHFERYYDLLSGPPPSARPIPHLVSGFPSSPVTYTDPTGINGITPSFIKAALEVPYSGFNGPICSLAVMSS